MGMITLYSNDSGMTAMWETVFREEIAAKEVEVVCAEVQNIGYHDILCTAGNSFGSMSGGLDLAVRELLGYGLQDVIQLSLMKDNHYFGGQMPVGSTLLVNDIDSPYCKILAYIPSMIVPAQAKPFDVMHCTTAAVYEGLVKPELTIAIPAFGAGVGEMPHDQCAVAMHIGYWAAKMWWQAGQPPQQ